MATPTADFRRSWHLPGFTLQGWVTALGGVTWAVVAGLTGQRDLMWPGLFLIALPLASWLTLAIGSRSPAAHRQVTPSELTAGGEITSRVIVRSARLNIGGAARYHDTYPQAVVGPCEASLPVNLGQHRIDHRLVVTRRGRHQLGPLRQSVADALGLARTRRLVPGTVEVLALPQVHPLEPLRAAAGLGSASDATVLKTSLIGSDDVLVREYLPGDDVRRIHWRSTARTGELMVRREEQAWDPSAVVLIDNRAEVLGGLTDAPQPDPRLEWLVSAAASIATHLIEHGFAVTVVDAAGIDPADPPPSGARSMLRHLAELEPRDIESLEPAVVSAPGGGRGQLLIALLGRLNTADSTALAAARREHQACWALVLEPAEIDPAAGRLLESTGWHVLAVAGGTSVSDAWQLFGERVAS